MQVACADDGHLGSGEFLSATLPGFRAGADRYHSVASDGSRRQHDEPIHRRCDCRTRTPTAGADAGFPTVAGCCHDDRERTAGKSLQPSPCPWAGPVPGLLSRFSKRLRLFDQTSSRLPLSPSPRVSPQPAGVSDSQVVRRVVNALGAGKKVDVRTHDSLKWRGTIDAIHEDGFRLKHGPMIENIPFGSVQAIKPAGLRTIAKVGIGAGIFLGLSAIRLLIYVT
jgi:hypothetical protein